MKEKNSIPKNPVVGIIGGTGAMGQLFKRFFEKEGLNVLISSDKTQLSPKELAKQADVVIFSIPISKTVPIIQEISPFAKKGSVLADFTSLKKDAVKTMQKYAPAGVEIVGMHPLFGPGINSFDGQTMVLCPGKGYAWLKWFKKIFKHGKLKVRIISPEEHDELMAIIQALRHFNIISYAKALKDSNVPLKQLISYSTPQNYLQMMGISHLLKQSPELYADIQLSNPHTKKILHKYFASVQKLKKIVDKNDKKAFIKFFKESQNFFEELNGEKTHNAKKN